MSGERSTFEKEFEKFKESNRKLEDDSLLDVILQDANNDKLLAHNRLISVLAFLYEVEFKPLQDCGGTIIEGCIQQFIGRPLPSDEEKISVVFQVLSHVVDHQEQYKIPSRDLLKHYCTLRSTMLYPLKPASSIKLIVIGCIIGVVGAAIMALSFELVIGWLFIAGLCVLLSSVFTASAGVLQRHTLFEPRECQDGQVYYSTMAVKAAP